METLSKNHLAKIIKYKQKKFIEEDSLVLVEGYRLLKQISEYGISFKELYVTEGNKFDLSIFKTDKIYSVPRYFIKKLSSTQSPQNIIALIKYEPKSINENYSRLLYLDNISDPGNLGTIVRTAVAFAFDGVVLSKYCVSVLNNKTIRQ